MLWVGQGTLRRLCLFVTLRVVASQVQKFICAWYRYIAQLTDLLKATFFLLQAFGFDTGISLTECNIVRLFRT